MKMTCIVLTILFSTAVLVIGSEWAVTMETDGGSIAWMDTDSDGNIYATGAIKGSINYYGTIIDSKSEKDFQSDMFLISCTPDGNIRWVTAGGGKGIDSGNYVAVGKDILFVAGQFSGVMEFGNGLKIKGAGEPSVFIACYGFDGILKWAKPVSDGMSVKIGKITVDIEGNLYTIGTFEGKSIDFGDKKLSSKDGGGIFLAKYSPDGKLAWVSQINSGNSFMAKVKSKALAVDKNGSLYIAGSVGGWGNFGGELYKTSVTKYSKTEKLPNVEAFIAKYDVKGKFEWIKIIGYAFEPRDMKISSTGEFVLTGIMDGVGWPETNNQKVAVFGNKTIPLIAKNQFIIPQDIFIAKYTPDAKLVWVESGGGYEEDYSECLVLDGGDNIIVGGRFFDSMTLSGKELSAGNPDYPDGFAVSYDKNGKMLWIKQAGGKKADYISSVTAGPDGAIYAAGCFEGEVKFGQETLKTKKWDSFFIMRIK